MPRSRVGTVITFYSFKGGTGRTQALANAAFLLACSGERVCAIDWDLEAPGLHRYFLPFLVDPELEISRGVVDFVWDLSREALTPGSKESERRLSICDYTVAVDWSFPNGGSLDFVPAGRQDKDYGRRITGFEWQRFYELMGGGKSLELARADLRREYAYTLIDSRTGLSDTSGICTMQLPDRLVACYTLNRQSIEGVASVLERVSGRITKKRALQIFPLEMRVEKNEKAKLEAARRVARPLFGQYVTNGAPDYWDDMEVAYWPYYAFEECLAMFGDDPATRTASSMIAAMERLTAEIAGVPGIRAPKIEESERRRVLELYALSAEGDRSDAELSDSWIELERYFRAWQRQTVGTTIGDHDFLSQRAYRRFLAPRRLIETLDETGRPPQKLANEPMLRPYLDLSRAWGKARSRALAAVFLWVCAVLVVALIVFVVAGGLAGLIVLGAGLSLGLAARALYLVRAWTTYRELFPAPSQASTG